MYRKLLYTFQNLVSIFPNCGKTHTQSVQKSHGLAGAKHLYIEFTLRETTMSGKHVLRKCSNFLSPSNIFVFPLFRLPLILFARFVDISGGAERREKSVANSEQQL